MKFELSGVKTLFRFKVYTIINIIGLVVSVAATLILVRYIHQEVTVDHFCKDLDQLHVLTAQRSNGHISIIDNSDRNNDPNFIDPLKHSEVEKYSSCVSIEDDYVIVDEHRYQAKVLATDSVFLQLMDYPVISGIKTIQRPDDVIISQKYAQHIFGSQDPLGRQFLSSVGTLLTIRGIIGEPSTKSSLQFDMLVPINQGNNVQWSRMGFSIVRLARGTNLQEYNEKISKPQSLICFSNSPIQYMLLSLKELYFNKTVQSSAASFLRGSKDHISVLAVVACMLLLVGIFNFINIYTVIILKRAREFGIKKVYGANGLQIFFQIYAENVYMVGIALLFIWMLIEATIGIFSSVYAIPVQSDLVFDLSLSLILLVGLPFVTSIYPFMRYNYSSPITSLRSVNVGGNSIVSRVLFLFIQYVITFCLIVVSLFFVRQLHTMLHADLGYQSKDIISCQFLSHERYDRGYSSSEEWKKARDIEQYKEQVIQRKMDECPLFLSWQYGEAPINLEPYIVMEYNGEKHKIAIMHVSKDYMNMFGFKLKEGREWNNTDQFEQYKIIINETAKKLFRIKDMNEASLQPESRLWWSHGVDVEKNPPFQVVGVIEDFRTGHLSKGNVPLAILYGEKGNPTDPLMATIGNGKRKEAIDFLKELHDEVIGKGDFNYTFIEDEIAKLYDEDRRTTRIYVTFSGLAICISCLGLFGLSLYDIRQRYREIALRKVNGATGKQIALLLLRKYLYILGAAFAVAVPLAYYIINDYTKDFAVKAPIGIGIFMIGFILTLLISLGTLLWQVRKAVRLNPGIIMKSE
ncbi:FtsX-like permease family protein [Bacteroides sp.]|uniref:ABC transporter permease n=1 Tax=Bacteroides sp. TaxID=29523 RepID=UPI002638B316|nr:FtsX-like permease family protein [Bacteroides sp.]MDD3038578.1 ABC transporter permease [Bacteroides sp.]